MKYVILLLIPSCLLSWAYNWITSRYGLYTLITDTNDRQIPFTDWEIFARQWPLLLACSLSCFIVSAYFAQKTISRLRTQRSDLQKKYEQYQEKAIDSERRHLETIKDMRTEQELSQSARQKEKVAIRNQIISGLTEKFRELEKREAQLYEKNAELDLTLNEMKKGVAMKDKEIISALESRKVAEKRRRNAAATAERRRRKLEQLSHSISTENTA